MPQNPWVHSSEACKQLGVSLKTLDVWREAGYLKPGTHWRSAPNSSSSPWIPEVIYHIRWCKEEIDYWKSHNAHIFDNEIAA